jgi:AraC-like DNA-binding protein
VRLHYNFITTPEINRIIGQIIHARQKGALAPLYFESKVLQLLVLQWQCAVAQNAPENRRFLHHRDQINMVRNMIEDSYRNPPGIHKLAKLVGMSETLLKADFKAVFGTTIFAYLFNYRMDMAQRFLEDPSLTISDIADQLGYKSLPHFTTSFKRKFDMPPLEYRKTHSLQPSGP